MGHLPNFADVLYEWPLIDSKSGRFEVWFLFFVNFTHVGAVEKYIHLISQQQYQPNSLHYVLCNLTIVSVIRYI